MISKKLKQYITAYKKVCSATDPYAIYALFNDLERLSIHTSKKELGNFLPENYLEDMNSYLCQILLRSNRRLINPQIMEWISGQNSKKISIPYPQKWKLFLKAEGLPINYLGSQVAFFFSQIKAWGRFFILLKHHLSMARKSYETPKDSYVVFCNLPTGAIPVEHPQNQNSTVVDWFLREQRISGSHDIIIQTKIVDKVTRRGRFILSPFALPKLEKSHLCHYLGRATSIFFSGVKSWVLGNWKAPFIASAALDVSYCTEVQRVAKSYLFSNSDFAVRPCWSYAAEKMGANVTLYFYSANINCFYKGQEKQSPPPPGYLSMSWPNYLVIDREQKIFLSETCSVKNKIEIAGSIDFLDSDESFPNIPERSIALFDISPFNYENVAALALIAPYYTSDIMAQFLEDVLECIKEFDAHLVWKRKREMPMNVLAKNYARIIEHMQADSHVIFVPPEISARRVLPHVRGAISIPFTSTAILAKEMGKDSVFYDSTGYIKYVSELSRGISVLGGRDELRRWMERNFHAK